MELSTAFCPQSLFYIITLDSEAGLPLNYVCVPEYYKRLFRYVVSIRIYGGVDQAYIIYATLARV